MQFVKKLTRGLLSSLLKFLLFTLAIVASILMVFGSPTQLKNTIKQSGIYGSIVDNALDTANQKSQENPDNNGGGIPFDRPEVRAAVKTALSPQFLQSSTEQVLDSIYRWLDNKTPTPDFRIDLTGPKQALANSLGDYAVTRAQSLPVCTVQQLRQLQQSGVNPNKVEPFDATCLPRGFNAASLKQQVVDKVANNGDLLKDPVISVDTLKKNDQGQDPFQKLAKVPKIFHLIKLAPYVLGAVAILSGTGLIFLYDERRRGLRNISITLLGTGLFLLIGAWLETFLIKKANGPTGPLGKQLASNSFQGPISKMVTSLSSALANKMYIFCAVFIVIGAGTLVALHFTKPKKPEHEHAAEKTDEKATDDNKSEETPEEPKEDHQDKEPKPETDK